jgi:hypothetical protein
MRKVLLFSAVIILTCFAQLTFADENPKNHYLDIDFGGVGGPVLKISQFGSGVLTIFGGRGGMTIAQVFMIGGGGYATITQSNLEIGGSSELVNLGYGLLGFGLKLFPSSIIQLSNFNNFGFGTINLFKHNEKSFCFIIEPELNLELSLSPFFRLGLGASYRVMFAKDLSLHSRDLHGFGGQFYLEFGWV